MSILVVIVTLKFYLNITKLEYMKGGLVFHMKFHPHHCPRVHRPGMAIAVFSSVSRIMTTSLI
jgi:hypothetical protein